MPRTVRDSAELPIGTATFLFTDIEGSTRLVQEVSPAEWSELLDLHRRLLREVFEQNHGVEVLTEGDAFFVAFGNAADAVAAATAGQQALAGGDWPGGRAIAVRMGLHTGEARLVGDDYEGIDIHRAARVASAAHGGQVLLSQTTHTLVGDSMPPGVAARDLGEHRLKDLLRPERVWQLEIDGLRSDFPAIKSLDATPNNLPTQLTSFVGREEELEQTRGLLGDSRLLTLTGPGGTGKTRLSMQLAAEAADDFPDGIYWVPLAPISDPALVSSELAQTLGLQETGTANPQQMLEKHLEKKRALLVLDNFEQVLEAASAVAGILQRDPEVKVIATSRAPLKVAGEQEFPVPPLGVPDPTRLPPLESLTHYAAVKLFLDRAVAIKPGFEVTHENAPAIAGIAALVDGLPLAIELAAARIRLLTPKAMLERLQHSIGELGTGGRDLPARQQTLAGAIAWSHDLLAPEVRRLMARMSVFVGGGSLAAIEAVCGPELGIDALSGVETLVEQSLLRSLESGEEPRFLMLFIIREFAVARLQDSDEEAAVRQRHAEFFLSLAEEAAPNYVGPEPAVWLARMRPDDDNIRAALTWFMAAGKTEEALRLVASFWRYWQLAGQLREGRARVEEALALPNVTDHPHALMGANESAGGIAWWQGDSAVCRTFYEKALGLALEVGTKGEVANARYNLANIAGYSEPEAGLRMAEEARAAFEAADDPVGAARAGWAMAGMLEDLTRWDEAYDVAQDAATRFRALNQPFDLAWALHDVAFTCSRLGRVEEGVTACREGMQLLVGIGDTAGMPIMLGDLSDLAIAAGDLPRGALLRGAATAIQETSGADLEERQKDAFGGRLDKDLDRTLPELKDAFEAGRRMSLEEVVAFALAADGEVGAPASSEAETGPE